MALFFPIAIAAPPSVTGIDWIAGLPVICDSDPRDGLSFPCQRSFPSLHGDVSEEHALAGEVSDEDDVLIVRNVAGGDLLPVHSQALLSNPLSQGEVAIRGFASVQETLSIFANK